jgi:molybdopterin molybdotransferase
MLSTYKARAAVLRHAMPGGTEVVPLAQLHNRVIGRPLIADCDLPRFDCSAVDGYAVTVADVAKSSPEFPSELKLQGRVTAGSVSAEKLASGAVVRILTGAPIPCGAEAVVMQEFTVANNGTVRVQRAVTHGENIRRRGGEYIAGTEALPVGTRLNAAGVGLMVTLGVTEFEVYVRPSVAVLTTGDEVVEPGTPLREGQIYDANAWTVICALDNLGIKPASIAHVNDDPAKVRASLDEALRTADVIITTGGASVGDTDHVKPALRNLGVALHFESVAMKPGKPTCFGTRGAQLVFGLPGNPVAVLVSFHHFVKPALRRMMGETSPEPITHSARLTQPLHKKSERAEWVRAKLHNRDSEVWVTPTSGQDSHMLGGLTTADCLVHFPSSAVALDSGSIVEIELL